MALKKCRECGNQVSTTASACPSCGAKVKKNVGCGGLIAVFILCVAVVKCVSFAFNPPAKRSATIEAGISEETRKKLEEAKQERRAQFEASIAENYQKLLTAHQTGQNQEALKIASEFQMFGRGDYENVKAITTDLRTVAATKRWEKLSSADVRGLADVYSQLAELHPENDEYKTSATSYTRQVQAQENAKRTQAASPQGNQPDARSENAADKEHAECKAELMRVPWVKDVYLSPGHMNIGVIRNEKQWTSPMIARFVKAILEKHGVSVQWIRFVDIEQVAYQRETVRDAEITKFEVNSL